MKHYDIFISYKNTSPDAQIAEVLYQCFLGAGFTVFFSRATLKQLGRSEYMDAIDEALDGSSVLLVVGTKPEHFASNWVKYEWSSFQGEILAGRGENRKIFTVTQGMPVKYLPYALRKLQNFPYGEEGGMLSDILEFVRNALSGSSSVKNFMESEKKREPAVRHRPLPEWITDEDAPEESGNTDGEAFLGQTDGDEIGSEYLRALAIVVKLGQASISLVQRKCDVGYNHAGKIIEWMENMGYISPFNGKAKARTVYLTKKEFESKYGPLD